MAKLALLTFTLVILNSTVRINADFQLITVLYKLIESVEQLNSSISKINGRLDKLEDTIPTRPEYIKHDPEPMHGRVDEKVKKAFESEKVLIRKSLSVCEKKFHVFEAQVNRHLSSMYTAIESNKDKTEEQIRLMNGLMDRKSDALHVQQEIRRINETFDQLYNTQRCSYSHDSFQLYSGNTKLNIVEHNSMVEVKCKNGDNYELKNTETDQYINSFNTKCLFGRLDKDLSVLKCLPKRCSYSHGSLQLYSGNTQLNIAEHDSTVAVKCKDVDNYELKNTKTDRFIDSYNTKCLFGHLDNTGVLICLPKRCSCSHGSFQLYSGNTKLNMVEHNSMVEVKCKNGDNYELKNTDTDQYIDSFNTKCLFGHLDNTGVLKCLPKRCFNENSKIALYTGDRNTRVVTHTSKVDVKCIDDGYELKNTKTVKYESNLTTTCTFGKFDYQISQLTCLIRKPDVKYSVYLKTSESRGQGVKVNVRIVGNGQTAEFQLNGVYNDRISNDLYFTGTDVRPIQSVVVSKDRAIRRDDDLSIEYVFLYIEESEEYYVFTGTSLHTNLTDSHPLTLTLSDHPEKCSSHTYGKALERTPHNLRSRRYVGRITLHECKIRCITTHSVKCKSVFHRPRGGLGHCYLIEHSPDDDRYFRDNNSGETNMGFVSYGRICKTT